VLNQNGCRARIVNVGRLRALQDEIERLRAKGAFSVEFFEQELAWLEYDAGRLPGTGSVIVVAAPQPAFRLSFHWQGMPKEVILPPTYAFQEIDRKLEALVESALASEPHSLMMIHPPLKLLAARSGLIPI